MKLTAALFIAVLSLNAETTMIDSGSSTDSNFTGGAAYGFAPPVTGTNDLNMRSGTFVYDIPCHDDWPYIITFEFFEPVVTTPGQRIFSVRVNNQIVLDKLDVFKETGAMKKAINRSIIALGANGHLIISFEPLVRTAIVSHISITPLLQIKIDPTPQLN